MTAHARPAHVRLATIAALAAALLLVGPVSAAVAADVNTVVVNSPASLAGGYQGGPAVFGPSTFNVTADVVQAQDLADAAGPSTTDGCTAFTNAVDVSGKIAIVDRGTCTFETKVLNAENAGAIGVIVAETATGFTPIGMADDPTITTPITIGSLRVTKFTGDSIKAQLADPVNATLIRGTADSCDDPGAVTDTTGSAGTGQDGVIDTRDGISGGNDYIHGDDDPEAMAGFGGNDLICGGGGNDQILGDAFGATGDDDLFGEGGNDAFNPTSAVSAPPSNANDPGADDYDGGADSDRLYYTADGDTVNNTVTPGDGPGDGETAISENDDVKASTEHVDFGAGNDTFNDYLVGADNTVRGGGGGDSLLGGAGKDLLLGQDGGDPALQGGADNDKVNGGTGGDNVTGGEGADHVYGGDDSDGVCGGTCSNTPANDGNDLIYAGAGLADSVNGDPGNDRVYGEGGADSLNGDDGHDSIFGGDDADGLTGGAGNDSLVPGPDSAADTLVGDAGTDTATYSNESGDVYVALGGANISGTDPDGPGGAANGSAEGDDVADDVENVATGAGNDTIVGNELVNYLLGNAGNDTIFGGDAKDTLVGKTGDDFLIGSDDVVAVKDILYCDGDTGVAPRDRFSADTADVPNLCETAATP